MPSKQAPRALDVERSQRRPPLLRLDVLVLVPRDAAPKPIEGHTALPSTSQPSRWLAPAQPRLGRGESQFPQVAPGVLIRYPWDHTIAWNLTVMIAVLIG